MSAEISSLNSVYEVGSSLLMRNPLFPVSVLLKLYETDDDQSMVDKLRVLYGRPQMREALYLGSPELYKQMMAWYDGKVKPEDLDKIEQSLLKYAIRITSRCTPFGLFATCTKVELSDRTSIELKVDEIKRHARLDMEFVSRLYDELLKSSEVRESLTYRSNNSLYEVGDNYRYIEHRYSGKGRKHHLVQLGKTKYLEKVLDATKTGKNMTELVALFEDDPVHEEDVRGYIMSLIVNQVLVSDLDPNVTGETFFERLYQFVGEIKELQGLTAVLERVVHALRDANSGTGVTAYQTVHDLLGKTSIPINQKALIQVDTYRNTKTSELNERVGQDVLRHINLLARLQPSTSARPELEEFKANFTKRYESRLVKLTEVLDSKLGIGFSNVSAKGLDDSPLINDLPLNGKRRGAQRNSGGSIEPYKWELYEKAIMQGLIHVELGEDAVESRRNQSLNPAHLPDSAYSMVKVVAQSGKDIDEGNYYTYVNGFTGPSAINLWGRFCHLDQGLTDAAFHFVKKEEAHDPGAVYAEIVHLPGARLGNILFRPHLRSYEIPYMAQSTLPEENQIQLSDLYVTVYGGKIILWSKKLNKQVIPRMSTAHNYRTSSLAIYQFLCSLQYQDATGYGWSWGGLSGRPFLPRVTYKNHILTEARWLLKKKELQPLLEASGEERAGLFQEFIAKRKLPEYVLYTQGDNKLLVHLKNEHCREILLSEVKKYGQINLSECIELDGAPTRDESGESYFSEYLFGFSKQIKQPKVQFEPPSFYSEESKLSRSVTTCEEWLYIKVYCGTQVAENLLSDVLAPLCEELEELDLVDKHFFLRYNDPEHHIRIRFHHTDNPDFWSGVMRRVYKELRPYLDKELIHRIQTDTYHREIERYGAETMELSETLFWIHSSRIMKFISQISSDQDEIMRWKVGLCAIDSIMNDFGLSLDEKANLAKINRDGFVAEFTLDKQQRKAISNKFYASRKELDQIIKGELEDISFQEALSCLQLKEITNLKTIEAILNIVNHETYKGSFDRLVSSFIHMFINRLFPSNQRAHELVIYDYLSKHYSGELGRLRNVKKSKKALIS